MSVNQTMEDVKQQCIFCQICSGKAPGYKIFEDEHVVGILDVKPAVPGHILLIPKEHYVVLPQLPEQLVAHLFIAAKKISRAMLQGLHVRGTNIFVANGAIAGQKAPHLLVHLIPREQGDNLLPELPVNTELVAAQQQLKVQLIGAGSTPPPSVSPAEHAAALAIEPPQETADALQDGAEDDAEEVEEEADDEEKADDTVVEDDDVEEADDDSDVETDEDDEDADDEVNEDTEDEEKQKSSLDDIAGLFK